MAARVLPVLSPPTEEQRRALQMVAAYLTRASAEASSRLLPGPTLLTGQLELMLTFGQDLRDSAVLCETLLEVFEGWPPEEVLER